MNTNMKLFNKAEAFLVRHHPHMKSLSITYPRINKQGDIHAVLSNRQDSGIRFKLPVLSADAFGIEIKLPALLTGMFYLQVEDGDQSIHRSIALQ